MRSRFDKVIVIGCGKIAGDVLRFVALRQADWRYKTLFIEHERQGISRLEGLCKEIGAAYEYIPETEKMTNRLAGIEGTSLIISAGNYYLFPRAIIEKPGTEIINFHNALLPKLPGRNAPSWAIYLQETVSGPTWHYVTTQVDSGAIIAQRQTPVTADVKAYELTRTIMELAFEAFQTFFEDLLARHIDGEDQPAATAGRRIYYSYEVPGEGKCAWDTPAEEIYRLLRSTDYGKNRIFPPVRMSLRNGQEVEILRYKKTEEAPDGAIVSNGELGERMWLPMGNGWMLEMKCRQVESKVGG